MNRIPSLSEPVASQLTQLLDAIKTSAISLFSATNAQNDLAILSGLDSRLAALLHIIQQHQLRSERLDQLQNVLAQSDQIWQHSIRQLLSFQTTLHSLLSHRNHEFPHIHVAVLEEYAKMLAPFTSAPPTLNPPTNQNPSNRVMLDPSGSRGLPSNAIPPFPTEGVMRRGRLLFGEGAVGDVVPNRIEPANQVQPSLGIPTHTQPSIPLPKTINLDLNIIGTTQTKDDDDDEFELDLDLS